MTIYAVYDQIADLIARLDPSKVRALKATEEMTNRLELLIEKSRETSLNKAEKEYPLSIKPHFVENIKQEQ